jgi:precorrin-6B methylase 1
MPLKSTSLASATTALKPSQTPCQTIADAEVLLGTDRTLALVPKSKAERHTISAISTSWWPRSRRATRVAQIYGDPMFCRLARYVRKAGKGRFVVVPHVSSMQLAFAV